MINQQRPAFRSFSNFMGNNRKSIKEKDDSTTQRKVCTGVEDVVIEDPIQNSIDIPSADMIVQESFVAAAVGEAKKSKPRTRKRC